MGLAAFGGSFTASPYLGYGLSEAGTYYSFGWRLAPAGGLSPDLSFNLRATQRESYSAQPEQTVELDVRATW